MYQSKNPYKYGTGRRKSSVARVHLFENGTGSITINGRLADIAPTILDVMGLACPPEMDGKTLIVK